jgi:hypothetical protein
MSRNVFSVGRTETKLNGRAVLCRGLRCSNGAFSDEVTDDLIANLEVYRGYGVNCISVFFMGNRFSDMRGYREDAKPEPAIAGRIGRIIEAADDLGMVVLVGCLYWGETKGKWESWTQKEANAAVRSTVEWISKNDYRNTFVDVDNEGMALRLAGFDNCQLVLAAKEADPTIMVATNYHGAPPEEADLAVHHSDRAPGKPYIQSEGTPENAPGGYWGWWSRKFDDENRYKKDRSLWNYLRVGQYNDDMRANSKWLAGWHFDRGDGFLFASTWLQAAPPLGPNHDPGGDGSAENPGIRWWLEWLKSRFGAYRPPAK